MKRILLPFIAIVALHEPARAEGDAFSFYALQAQTAATKASEKAPEAATGSQSRADLQGHGPAAADVVKVAEQLGVPRSLALSVCRVESKCRYGLVGRQGERGPLQIKLQTARGLGYVGNAAGLNGFQGAYWGVKHLAVAYQKCGNARGAAKLHQAGLGSGCGGSRYASAVMSGL